MEIILFFLAFWAFICIVVLCSVCTGIYSKENSSKKISYKKNFFDWIIYILAWIAIPFSPISMLFAGLPFMRAAEIIPFCKFCKKTNWEQLRRFNLYSLMIPCTIGLIYFSGNKEQIDFDNPLSFIILLCVLCALWKLMEKYENHIESKSTHIKKGKNE